MRYLGPLQFKVHAESDAMRNAGARYEPLARVMIGQMIAYSGEVAINDLTRTLPNGTRIRVWMNRAGMEPLFLAQVWPTSEGEETPAPEDEIVRPYFFAGLQWIEGGELIGDRFNGPNGGPLGGGGSVNLKTELGARDARVIPHLVVWEPGEEGKQDIPVMVKRWANPVRPPTWGVRPAPSDDTYFMGPGFVNAAITPQELFLNYRNNAYWWYSPALGRWRYHFFARSENGLVVWEYDNLGRHSFTPHPAYTDPEYLSTYDEYALAPVADDAERYLAIAEMNPKERLTGRDYDEVSFTSYPQGFSWPPGEPFNPTYLLGSGYGERFLNTPAEPLSPEPPNHPATFPGGAYLCKVVVESFGPSYNWAPLFAPLTVRLTVDSGLKSDDTPAIRDTYTLTITGSSHARRILHPGGYFANADQQPPPAEPPFFNYTDFGPNLGGSAWSTETIAIFPEGGSGLTDQLPWGVGASTADIDWRIGFAANGYPVEPDYAYRAHYSLWLDGRRSYGFASD